MTINESYQAYLDASPQERLTEAIEASNVVLSYLNSQTDPETASIAYLMLIGSYVGADGAVQPAEYEFCKQVFGFDFSFDEFYDMVSAACNEENVELIDNIIDSAPADVKFNFVSLGIAICACNGTLSVKEQQLLTKYIV